MNALSTLIAIITLVVSILQIVLFFKIWQMTNDTAEIKEILRTILSKKLPVERRKDELLKIVYKKINIESLLIDEPKVEVKEIRIYKAVDSHKVFIQDQLALLDIADMYSIEELKRDIVEKYVEQ